MQWKIPTEDLHQFIILCVLFITYVHASGSLLNTYFLIPIHIQIAKSLLSAFRLLALFAAALTSIIFNIHLKYLLSILSLAIYLLQNFINYKNLYSVLFTNFMMTFIFMYLEITILSYANYALFSSLYKSYFIFTGLIFPFTPYLIESITNIFPIILIIIFLFNIYLFWKHQSLTPRKSLNAHNPHALPITYPSLIFLIVFTAEIAYSNLSEFVLSSVANFTVAFRLHISNYKIIILVFFVFYILFILSTFMVNSFSEHHAWVIVTLSKVIHFFLLYPIVTHTYHSKMDITRKLIARILILITQHILVYTSAFMSILILYKHISKYLMVNTITSLFP
ncbi:hypothetical protein EBI_26004 [Enterocytozoon bieneusi H348]|nr:hypothetical protein EBI_26004 [Enterocytozoon bieneusi H348]|eukprot:XP_002651426.1 hypothetical protein EBI_26004 [Enterocytozoon bieneusi H348]